MASNKSILITVFVGLLYLPILLLLVFPITSDTTFSIIKFFNITSLNTKLVIDSLVTFLILCLNFSCLIMIKKICANAVIVFVALFMFAFWGIESEFFWKGLNPMYPIWYEINMALNDVVAALLIIYINKGVALPFRANRFARG